MTYVSTKFMKKKGYLIANRVGVKLLEFINKDSVEMHLSVRVVVGKYFL